MQDYQRQIATDKRSGQVVPIDYAKAAEITRKKWADTQESESSSLNSILAWIDVERVVAGDSDRKNARRNALIFQLHYINGFESGEICSFPGIRAYQVRRPGNPRKVKKEN